MGWGVEVGCRNNAVKSTIKPTSTLKMFQTPATCGGQGISVLNIFSILFSKKREKGKQKCNVLHNFSFRRQILLYCWNYL